MKKLLFVGLMLAGLFAGRAEAAGSITLVETAPQLGDTIHFNHVNPAGLKDTPCKQGVYDCAWFQVFCYQGANRVYSASKAAADNFTQFILGSPDMGNWQQVGGDAECRADLTEIKKPQHTWEQPIVIVYATTFFHVDG